MKKTLNGFTFSSQFDSGNLDRVEAAGKNAAGDTTTTTPGAEFEFNCYTTADCAGTRFATTSRSWFHFCVTGGVAGQILTINIFNMNKQSRLYSQGLQPVVRVENGSPSQLQWGRHCVNVEYDSEDGEFSLTFSYELTPKHSANTCVYFAFCYPFSYTECQDMLADFDAKYARNDWIVPSVAEAARQQYDKRWQRRQKGGLQQRQQQEENEDARLEKGKEEGVGSSTGARDDSGGGGGGGGVKGLEGEGDGEEIEQQQRPVTPPPVNTMYYHRELLTTSIEGRRMDLLTITSLHGMQTRREERLPGLFPERGTPRAHSFGNKPVYYLSARVHPGETPASHCFNGFLRFILRQDDPRAIALRRLYVFKLVPILNPDGVFHGHYRNDTRGVNLNRWYNAPDPSLHPTIWAARTLCVYHAARGALRIYLDLHAHASKRGIFIYGNSLDGKRQVDNVLYAKLIALNSAHFDFEGCNFSEKNMFSKDKRDGQSKEGSGRVGIFYATDLTHVYTLECNYNTGLRVNQLPLADGDHGGRAERPELSSVIPKYDISHFADVGRGCALAALDLREANPWSRLPNSEFACLSGVRRWTLSHIRGSNKMKAAGAATKGRIAVARRQHRAANPQLSTATDPSVRGGIGGGGGCGVSGRSGASSDQSNDSARRRQEMAATSRNREAKRYSGIKSRLDTGARQRVDSGMRGGGGGVNNMSAGAVAGETSARGQGRIRGRGSGGDGGGRGGGGGPGAAGQPRSPRVSGRERLLGRLQKTNISKTSHRSPLLQRHTVRNTTTATSSSSSPAAQRRSNAAPLKVKDFDMLMGANAIGDLERAAARAKHRTQRHTTGGGGMFGGGTGIGVNSSSLSGESAGARHRRIVSGSRPKGRVALGALGDRSLGE